MAVRIRLRLRVAPVVLMSTLSEATTFLLCAEVSGRELNLQAHCLEMSRRLTYERQWWWLGPWTGSWQQTRASASDASPDASTDASTDARQLDAGRRGGRGRGIGCVCVATAAFNRPFDLRAPTGFFLKRGC
jgi:hypothetical protein